MDWSEKYSFEQKTSDVSGTRKPKNPRLFDQPEPDPNPKKIQNPKKPDKILVKILVNTGYILLISSKYLSKNSNADSMEPFFHLLVVK